MPQYTFECQNEACNCRFDRNLKMAEHTEHICPSCGQIAPRCLEGEGFAFGFKVDGSQTGNSGVHKEDYPTADHAVGRSAESRWASYNERKKVKDHVRQHGVNHALVRRDGDGYSDYEAMSPVNFTGRKAVGARALAAIRAAKEGRAGSR
jgi:putative FmdB family regulatory protein